MLDARMRALEQPQRLQRCAQSGLGSGRLQGQAQAPCTRWNVVQFDAARH
jgi:hypothetical protein